MIVEGVCVDLVMGMSVGMKREREFELGKDTVSIMKAMMNIFQAMQWIL